MNATETIDYEHVLHLVLSWPASQRFTLVQEVLKTLAPVEPPERATRQTLIRARGLLATEQAAPSDEEIAQWLDERQNERYGG